MIRTGGSGLCFFFFVLIPNTVFHLQLLPDLFPHLFPFLLRACAERVTVVVSCVYVSVCLSEHAILAIRAIRSITKDAIVLSVRSAAILKRRFS